MRLTMKSFPTAVLVVALASALAACGDDGNAAVDATPNDGRLPLDAPARQIIMETQSLVPGELAEGIMTGGVDDYAVIHLEAPVAELDWNLHGHQNGETQVIFEQLNQRTVDYVFHPPGPADWYLLIRNSGPAAMDVTIHVELYGDLQWRWQ